MRLTLSKWGLGSLLGLSKLQSLIARVKTPCIKVFFISLEIFQSIDVENGLIWAIWTSVGQVKVSKRAGSQIRNSTSNH
jgi:hypothetical protein